MSFTTLPSASVQAPGQSSPLNSPGVSLRPLRPACVLSQGHLDTQDAKVDSSQPIVASSGALQHIIANYLNGTITNLSAALQESSEFISGTLGVPPTFVYSGLAALVALPITMSRYGWSLNREQSFGASSGGVPDVTNEDFSYITAQDLDDPRVEYTDTRYYPRPRSRGPSEPEDDILLIKSKGVTYPAHFPAYSIGDGKLYVKDVRERIGLLMDLPPRTTRHVKLLYKGKQLKESSVPVRDYGVKNKSELMAVIPDADDDNSGRSEDDLIIVDEPRNDTKSSRSRKKKKSSKRKSDKNEPTSPTSPVDSGSNADAANAPSPTVVNAAMKKLDDISEEFRINWLPQCLDYIDAPPRDAKKRDEEHRKLSESVLQQIILKLDGVETEGVDEIRLRRKDLVRRVQDVLKRLDAAKAT
ncbi:BAG domain-containing protein [Trichoderma novae-zelandiae]